VKQESVLTQSMRPFLEKQHPKYAEGWEVTKIVQNLPILNGTPDDASEKCNTLVFEREVDEDQAIKLALEEMILKAQAPEGHVLVLVERPAYNPVLLTVAV
jgi:hypothetical protein